MFGKNPLNSENPPPATGARETPFSLIGSDVVLTGNITAGTDFHIDGRIDGDVSCATLVQGTDSVIKGSVDASVARIAGTVEGSVTADEVIVERGGRILGDCTYGSIVVSAGGTIKGRFDPKTPAAPELKVVAVGVIALPDAAAAGVSRTAQTPA